VSDLSPKRIEQYKALRRSQTSTRHGVVGPVPYASINRELGVLRRGLNLAAEQDLIKVAPRIKLYPTALETVRQGFCEAPQFAAIVRHLPEALAALATFLYLTGWRLREATTLQWEHVDRVGRLITLRREHEKTATPRELPLVGDLWKLVEQRWHARTYTRDGNIVATSPWVFHSNGRPIGDFRKAWRRATTAAGCPGVLVHDFRRSFVQNCEDNGVSQAEVMSLTGHRTVATYLRYAIKRRKDRARALEAVQAGIQAALAAAGGSRWGGGLPFSTTAPRQGARSSPLGGRCPVQGRIERAAHFPHTRP
jgi:integrase